MYDVIIIGGGPAGYRAAERFAELKRQVLLVEKAEIGGTCLNVGCIPTKTLINSAKLYVHAREGERFGVKAEGVSFDLARMMAWKTEVVEKLRAGIVGGLKHGKVEIVAGSAEILGRGKVRVLPAGGEAKVEECKAILVATGSTPIVPPIPGVAGNALVVDSTGALDMASVPKRFCVIGGGVIGVEFASLYSSLGSEVTVVEMMDEIVPFMDADLAPVLRRAMKDVKWKLGCKVEAIDAKGGGDAKGVGEGATVRYVTKDGTKEAVEADLVLMAIGRRPVLQGWGAEAAGLDLTPRGVVTDDRMRTSVPGIWAAGDLTGRSQLAHSAYRMAEVAALDIEAVLAGESGGPMRWRGEAVPWAVYSLPEAAGVGMTEQEAKAKGIDARSVRIPLRASGRFAAENGFQAHGAVKLVAEAGTGRILGVHCVGSYASETIWGGAALIEQETRVAELREIIMPHPTVWELLRDAAWQLEV